MRLSVFLATSLDGYIARPDGAIVRLEPDNTAMLVGEDCNDGFIGTGDVLVPGLPPFSALPRHRRLPLQEACTWPFGVVQRRHAVVREDSPS